MKQHDPVAAAMIYSKRKVGSSTPRAAAGLSPQQSKKAKKPERMVSEKAKTDPSPAPSAKSFRRDTPKKTDPSPAPSVKSLRRDTPKKTDPSPAPSAKSLRRGTPKKSLKELALAVRARSIKASERERADMSGSEKEPAESYRQVARTPAMPEKELKLTALPGIRQSMTDNRPYPPWLQNIVGLLPWTMSKTDAADLQSARPYRKGEQQNVGNEEALQYFMEHDVSRPLHWWDKQHVTDDPKKRTREIMDWLWMCCMVTTEVPFVYFQGEFVQHGGVYFILVYVLIIYFIVFPLLHMELLVGQLCQAGVCKTFRMYGRLFEGFGFAIFFVGCLRSIFYVQRSYLTTVHFFNVLRSASAITDCRTELFKNKMDVCTSIVSNRECGVGMFYYGTGCTNTTEEITAFIPAAKQYFQTLVKSPSVFDSRRALFLLAVYTIIAVVCYGGVKRVRAVLAGSYCVVIVVFLLCFFNFLSIAEFDKLKRILWRLSTPDSLFKYRTYRQALHNAVLTTGLGLCGVLCASSFRDRKADSYKLTSVLLVNNVVINVLSCFIALCIASVLESVPRLGTSYEPRGSGFQLAVATVPEVMLFKEKSSLWIILYSMLDVWPNLLTVTAGIVMVCALVRDEVDEALRRTWTAGAVVIFCAVACLLSIIRCRADVGLPWERILQETFNISIYFFLAGMVVVLIQIYGPLEYVSDMAEVSCLRRHWNAFNSPFKQWHMKVFLVLPVVFVFIQLPHIAASIAKWSKKESDHWVRRTFLTIGVIPLATSVLMAVYRMVTKPRTKAWSSLISVTPEHPSYKRITTKDPYVATEEVSEK